MKAQLVYNRRGEVRVLLHDFDGEERRVLNECTDLRGVMRQCKVEGEDGVEEGDLESVSFEPVRFVQVR